MSRTVPGADSPRSDVGKRDVGERQGGESVPGTDLVNRRILLVRHGETVGESSTRFHGRNDVALAESGRAQMARVAAALATERIGSSQLTETPS